MRMLRQFIILLVLAAALRATAEDLIVVMGADSATDSLTAAELTKVFRGEKTKTADGKKFAVIMREAGSAERTAALERIYGMTEQEYKTYFLQATFTGSVAAAPKTQAGADALKVYLSKTPGAIGYMLAKDVDASVKVIKIDGKAPGEADYKLKGK